MSIDLKSNLTQELGELMRELTGGFVIAAETGDMALAAYILDHLVRAVVNDREPSEVPAAVATLGAVAAHWMQLVIAAVASHMNEHGYTISSEELWRIANLAARDANTIDL